jgi:predicted dehydrogenase
MSGDVAPLKVLVAGAGPFGQEHLMRLAARADVKIVGVADPDAGARQRARAGFGVETCVADTMELIDSTAAHAIIVATPAASHVAISQHALGAGLCVLVEKPAAVSAESAQELIAAAAKAKGLVLPGHVLRFSRDHQRLVEIVRSGRIGSVLYVNSRRYRDDNHALRFPDTDPILMTLIHDIDLAQWITNADFSAVHAHRCGGPGFRSMTTITATTSTRVVCDLRTCWTFSEGQAPPDSWEVVGDRGSVQLTAGQGVTLYCEGRVTVYTASEGDDPLHNEHDHFLACVRDRSRRPAIGLAEALVGLELADAAMRSLREHGAVAIDT